ncbi:MAG: cytochrome c oxidase assembly protein [Alphaproteobacteria bacterium TMED89]|nr:cytochrome c oxidase assembly protein [Rhodospirillaceae bacterium]RPH09864.1 MAG: cytochrome c oxidase assembly protein [Alphaproteobacteria bacterium TMED89]
MTAQSNPAAIRNKNTRVLLLALGVIAGMLVLVATAPAAYRKFCEITGISGTTQVGSAADLANAEQAAELGGLGEIEILFTASVDPSLDWKFRPKQRTVTVPIGEQGQVDYYAKNRSITAITRGTATFNVTPLQAGRYFSKIQCFCFEDQQLEPGQEVDMPVIFYVDPAIRDDPDLKDLRQITLAYTFFNAAD